MRQLEQWYISAVFVMHGATVLVYKWRYRIFSCMRIVILLDALFYSLYRRKQEILSRIETVL